PGRTARSSLVPGGRITGYAGTPLLALSGGAARKLRARRWRFDDHVRSVLVGEAVEHTRLDKASRGFFCVGQRSELEEDEYVIRIVRLAEYPLDRRLLSCERTILVEHRSPGVVVADLDAR